MIWCLHRHRSRIFNDSQICLSCGSRRAYFIQQSYIGDWHRPAPEPVARPLGAGRVRSPRAWTVVGHSTRPATGTERPRHRTRPETSPASAMEHFAGLASLDAQIVSLGRSLLERPRLTLLRLRDGSERE